MTSSLYEKQRNLLSAEQRPKEETELSYSIYQRNVPLT